MRNLLKRPFLLTVVLLLILPGVLLAIDGELNPAIKTSQDTLKKFWELKYGAFICGILPVRLAGDKLLYWLSDFSRIDRSGKNEILQRSFLR